MTDNTDEQPWMRFRVAGDADADDGVDARALAQLLLDLSAAARLIASEMLGQGRPRGPMSKLERSLAAFRVVSVAPGSVDVALAEPLPVDDESDAALDDLELTADAVARELVEALAAAPPDARAADAGPRRMAIERVMRSAARIGDRAEIALDSSSGWGERVELALGPFASSRVKSRLRVMFGHVSPDGAIGGETRVRVDLVTGSKAVMRVADAIAGDVPEARRLCELHVSKPPDGDASKEQLIEHIRVFPDLPPAPPPPKSIEELAREQGLLDRPPPDYAAILGGLFETEAEAQAFRDEIRRGRIASP